MDSSTPTPGCHASDRPLEELRSALGADFEVLRTLGRGSVATVYLAKDRALGVPVAIKVLRPGKAAEETARRRFEREARAAASLADHPNAVPVTRFGRLPDETPYLVMPYVHGRTAEDLLKAEGPLPVPQATQILREVASALAFAHGKGIVHRDVRPANVLWDEERSRARLTDFGIAAVINLSGTETTRLTKTGQLLGEPMHLSPEQLLDEGISELADMYLFGILGYELLAGRGPYDARTPTEWINAHLNKEPRDLKELRPDAPVELAALLRRCLAKQPQHRPSARDVARALEGPAASGAALSPGTTPTPGPAPTPGPDDLGELVRRRVPHIVLFTLGIGVALIGLADAVDEYFPEGFKLLVVIFVVAAVLASAVIAWFHGERGKQRAPAIEYLLLGLIGLAWMVVSVMAVL